MSANSNSNALKFLTGILALLLLGLGIYTVKFYNQVQNNEAVQIREKQLIQNELESILKKYNAEIADANVLKTELIGAKNKIEGLLKDLKTSDASQNTLQNYRLEIRELRDERDALLKSADSLSRINESLIAEKEDTKVAFVETLVQRDSLKVENADLQDKLIKGAKLTISNLQASGIILRSNGNHVENDRARRIDDIEVCYIVNENPLANRGETTLYVQVIDPQNNVMGDRKTVEFGEKTLLYSAVNLKKYENRELQNCTLIHDMQKDFTEGVYIVNVFEDERLLSSSLLQLN
ncbi:MAG: hypothetical protein V7767_12710 [Leeuwenhoekiella sp.]